MNIANKTFFILLLFVITFQNTPLKSSYKIYSHSYDPYDKSNFPQYTSDQVSVLTKLAQNYDPNCAQWKQNQCIKCASRTFFKNGKCERVNDLCKNFDQQTGQCTSCYEGYKLVWGFCKVNTGYTYSQSTYSSYSNPLCAQWQGQICLKCSQRTYKDQNGICKQVSSSCKDYYKETGKCKSCYSGYELIDGKCMIGNTKTYQTEQNQVYKINPLCKIWKRGRCVQCSQRSYRNQNDICIKVSDLCQTFNEIGQCQSCFEGYILTNQRECIIQNQIYQRDGLCVSWKGRRCIECADRSFLNSNGRCIQIDPYCKNYQKKTGQCQQCYSGYQLRNNKCRIYQIYQLKNPAQNNPFCSKFSQKNPLICLKCSYGTYMNNGLCTQIDPRCKTFLIQSGKCQSCYLGYTLVQNTCYLSSQIQRISARIAKKRQVTIQNIYGCNQYEGNNCIRCQPNYQLYHGRCYAFKFGPKYELQQKKQLILCLQWKYGYCIRCYGNLVNIQGKCLCPL